MNIGHWELKDFLLSKGQIAKSGSFETELLYKFDICLSGHYHTGSCRKSGDNIIKYIGSPYCLDWGAYEDGTNHGLYTFDTLSHKLDFIPNPEGMSMFQVIEYNYADIASKRLGKKYLDVDYLNDDLGLRDSIVRVEITNKENSAHYKNFIAALRLSKVVNYTTVDLTKEVETCEQEVSEKEWKHSTIDVLLEKVDSTEGIDNERVSGMIKASHKRCVESSSLS